MGMYRVGQAPPTTEFGPTGLKAPPDRGDRGGVGAQKREEQGGLPSTGGSSGFLGQQGFRPTAPPGSAPPAAGPFQTGGIEPPPGGPGATTGTPGGTEAQMYQPLLDLQKEAQQYREDLKAGTGRIAGQIAGATGDWLSGMQSQAQMDALQRGVGGTGVESQMQQQARDTAMRSGAKQLGDLATQREAMLGGAISSALPITSAAPELALREKGQGLAEKGLALSQQQMQAQAANQQYQNQMQQNQQAFQQYMALMNSQRQSPAYTGFRMQ